MFLNLKNLIDLKQKLILLITVIFIYLFSLKIGYLQLRYLIIIPALIFFIYLFINKFILKKNHLRIKNKARTKEYDLFKGPFLLGLTLLLHLLIVTYFESNSINFYSIFGLVYACLVLYFANRYSDLILKNIYNVVLIFYTIFFSSFFLSLFFSTPDDPFFCGGINLNQLTFLKYFFNDETSVHLKDLEIIKISFKEFLYKENSHLAFIGVPTIIFSSLIFLKPNTPKIFKISTIIFLIICLIKSSTTLLVGLTMSILILFIAEYKRIKLREMTVLLILLFLVIFIFFNDKQCTTRLIPEFNEVNIIPELDFKKKNSSFVFERIMVENRRSTLQTNIQEKKILSDLKEELISSNVKVPDLITKSINNVSKNKARGEQEILTGLALKFKGNNQSVPIQLKEKIETILVEKNELKSKKINKITKESSALFSELKKISTKDEVLSKKIKKKISDLEYDKNVLKESIKLSSQTKKFITTGENVPEKLNKKISTLNQKIAVQEESLILYNQAKKHTTAGEKVPEKLNKKIILIKSYKDILQEKKLLSDKAEKFTNLNEKVPKEITDKISKNQKKMYENRIGEKSINRIFESDDNFSYNLKKNLGVKNGSLSGAVFFHHTRLSIISLFVKPFGWGFNRYHIGYKFLDDKYRDKKKTLTIKLAFRLNTKDGSNNFNKLLVEFGIFGVLIFMFLIFYTFSKKIPLEEKFFLLPFLITQSIRGAGYFNGGFALILFIVFLSCLRHVNLVKN